MLRTRGRGKTQGHRTTKNKKFKGNLPGKYLVKETLPKYITTRQNDFKKDIPS